MFGSHPWTALNFSLLWTLFNSVKKKSIFNKNWKTVFAWRWETWMSRSRQYNYYLRIDTKVYTAKVLIFCLWVLIDLKKIIMTHAEVRERSCNKNLESYTFLFFLCIHWKTFFCPSLFTQTKQKPMHRCEWRYYEETFQLFLSLSLSLDMLDMNSIQFHSGIKEKKKCFKMF